MNLGRRLTLGFSGTDVLVIGEVFPPRGVGGGGKVLELEKKDYNIRP